MKSFAQNVCDPQNNKISIFIIKSAAHQARNTTSHEQNIYWLFCPLTSHAVPLSFVLIFWFSRRIDIYFLWNIPCYRTTLYYRFFFYSWEAVPFMIIYAYRRCLVEFDTSEKQLLKLWQKLKANKRKFDERSYDKN